MRQDGREADGLRPISVQRHFTRTAPGSVLIQAGRTTVLCTASVEETVPPWKESADDPTGWVTAEYSMLPGSTSPRKRRERGKTASRSTEIQRLIGRSLRAVVDLAALGPRTVIVDCDVLEADGGTRTLSITGGFIALAEACIAAKSQRPNDSSVVSASQEGVGAAPVFRDSVAAVSVGVLDGRAVLDLDYAEDSRAEVDMNVVMTGGGEFVEIQGTAEGRPFSRQMLLEQLALAERGIAQLTAVQRDALGGQWPLDTPPASC